MNDRHLSGTMTTPAPASDASSAPYASYGTQEAAYGDFTTYGGYDASGFATGEAAGTYAADPLFGASHSAGHDTGSYDGTQWSADGHHTPDYDAYAAQHHTAYGTGAYDAGAWSAGQQLPLVPPQATASDTGGWESPGWDQDASAWQQPAVHADGTQQWAWGAQGYDTGAYDATQWNSDGSASTGTGTGEYDLAFHQQATATFEQVAHDGRTSFDEHAPYDGHDEQTSYDGHDEQASYDEHTSHDEHTSYGEGGPGDTGELPAVELLDDQEEFTPAPRAASRSASRARRRTPAKRSALLTVAVPSACVMGVAGIAAASVGTLTGGEKETTATTKSDAQPVKPAAANNKLDTQLESLSAGADDFADRASRTQERIDLKAQQDLEKKRAAEEAARKERLRPKFALPVAQHGLSAYYGQSGVNWMSLHTGIDFPVSYGTPVLAATDGTVRTQWNSAYGNMMIVTAMDGTETWYCHLSSYQLASGTTVKAGDTIAYSGNSGNSTGPHLHFEVRPGGGSSIDPLSWLRSHGLEPS
ncbi:M23 family metallopeptidase [Streptomyces sp. NPDC093094]|uniref:M23 family metallopeptidase n=1 Tax=Streptomyces sp. NPDC093094 TaxID=3366026 RepID=UPI0038006B01